MMENDKNISTKIVAATFENEIGSEEVSGETVWQQFGFFDPRKSDYSMEKVNYAKNSLLYINQAYLTVKRKANIIVTFLFLGRLWRLSIHQKTVVLIS